MNQIQRQTIVDRFEALAGEDPEAVFLTDEHRSWSRHEIYRYVSALAGQLRENVTPGMHVGLLISDSSSYTSAFLALLKLGALVIPFNPRWSGEAKQRCADQMNVPFFVVDAHNKREIGRLNTPYFLMKRADEIWKEAADDESGTDQSDMDAPMVMFSTSGSTAEPKAIILTQRQMIARVLEEEEEFRLSGEDVMLISTPLCHALATRMILTGAYTGIRLVIMRGFTAEKWVSMIGAHEITYTISTSAQLAQVVRFMENNDLPEDGFSSMRQLVSTAACLDPDVRDSIRQILPGRCHFYNLLASSETEFIAIADLGDESAADDVAGIPVSRVQIRIENDKIPAGTDEVGEIFCRGEAVFDGYYIAGTQVRGTREDGFFGTGDLGYLDGEGVLHYAGRKKKIIISGGMNIFPGDIETEIRKLEGVRECVAYPLPDDILGEVVGVVVAADERVDLKAVKKRCLESLSDYQQPRDIRFVDHIPRDELGKISWNDLHMYL